MGGLRRGQKARERVWFCYSGDGSTDSEAAATPGTHAREENKKQSVETLGFRLLFTKPKNLRVEETLFVE